MLVYRRASASHFGSRCGNIHETQAKGAAHGGATSCACSRCGVLAEVDISDISSSHNSSVIRCLVGGVLLKMLLGWKSGGLCSGVSAVDLFSALLFYAYSDFNGHLVNK